MDVLHGRFLWREQLVLGGIPMDSAIGQPLKARLAGDQADRSTHMLFCLIQPEWGTNL